MAPTGTIRKIDGDETPYRSRLAVAPGAIDVAIVALFACQTARLRSSRQGRYADRLRLRLAAKGRSISQGNKV
jgi:hypothetical protein